jgi:hypothetical protein
VRLVDDEHDATTAFAFFGGQQGLGLRDQFGFLGTWSGTQRVNKGQVQTACAEGWCGDVDDVMGGWVQLAGRRAHRNGLANTHFAGDDAQQRLADAEPDPRDGFLVTGAIA